MSQNRQFPCSDCGADLKFEPGVDALTCPYCGTQNAIEATDQKVEELDLVYWLDHADDSSEMVEVMTVKCDGCGVETSFDDNVTSDECPYCGTSLVKATNSHKLIKPESLLPFAIKEKEAHQAFREWIASLWFAPNKLKKYARPGSRINGVYTPYWTYDADTNTDYTGERGDYYYTTESYTTTENGQSVTKTRQVRHTRWSRASGHVHKFFDDVLVLGSTSLPKKYTDKLQPWDLTKLVPYQDAYMSGFRSESYTVDLKEGFVEAKDVMEDKIISLIRQDIGGDEQRINHKDIHYSDLTFKHILLPIWLNSYKYSDKVYNVVINAQTGKVQGGRPYSWIKITFAVLLALAIIATIVYFVNQNG